MTNLKISIAVLISFLLTACQDREIRLSNGSDDRIYIPVLIGDSIYDFIFDTGAEITVLPETFKGKLGVTQGERHVAKADFLNKSDCEVEIYDSIGLSIGDHFVEIPCVISRSSDNSYYVLGLNVISQFYWYFDFSKNMLRVSQSPISLPSTNGVTLFYRTNENMLVTLRTMQKESLNLVFDTGMGFTNTSEQEGFFPDIMLLQKADWEEYIKQKHNHTDLFFGKENSDIVFRIPQYLECANGVRVEYPLCFYKQVLNNRSIDGYVTIDFVRRYTQLYIDPIQNTITFWGYKSEKEALVRKVFNEVRSNL